MAPSARLVAFLGELDHAVPAHLERAEALILRVPGEGQAAMSREAEADLLVHVGEELIPPVQAWVEAVKRLAEAERGWGPTERAREAGQAFNEATERFLTVWDRLLLVQPATEPMRHVLGLVHRGCYEFFLSGPRDLWRSAQAIVEGKAGAKLEFAPAAPSLNEATQLLRELRAPGGTRGRAGRKQP